MDASVEASMDSGSNSSPDVLDTDVNTDSNVDPLPAMLPPPRMAGQRAPMTAECDPLDVLRCLLPWPSNTFTTLDASRATGIHLQIAASRLIGDDDPTSLRQADGFSRVSPVMSSLSGVVANDSLGTGTTAVIRVYKATPGEGFGTPVPLRLRSLVQRGTGVVDTLLIANPLTPFEPATDYVAVVMDSAQVTEGPAPTASPLTRAALGLAPPTTGTEARYFAYHAPSREALMRAGVDLNHVVRVWDFTTRSAEDPLRTLRAMHAQSVAASRANSYAIAIDRTVIHDMGPLAMEVEGRLTGLPDFLDRDRQTVARDANGMVRMTGTHEAPFRVTIPRGMGNYRIIMFGHGLGGNFNDTSFDVDIAMAGAAKVGVRFVGFTDLDVTDTIAGMVRVAAGSDWAVSLAMQSIADAAAIQYALAGNLGTTLSAPMIGGMNNPATGRRPDLTHATWAGGSLGGTLGYVYSQLEPSIEGAVLNVPGAGWSQYLVLSEVFSLARTILLTTYRNDVNLQVGVAIAQNNFDGMDGANWWTTPMARRPPVLIQQSMGDPVLPAPGTEMVATTARSQQLGAALSPVYGVTPAMGDSVTGGAAFTQYRVPHGETGSLAIHGFGARDTPAGFAAREQIFSFIQSIWAGSPRVVLPSLCVQNMPANSCDFSAR